MSAVTCATCRFYHPEETMEDGKGLCHRFPPERGKHGAFFIEVHGDWDCGEHRPAAERAVPRAEVTERLNDADFETLSRNLADTAIKWVKDRLNSNTDWRDGLAEIIETRLRHAPELSFAMPVPDGSGAKVIAAARPDAPDPAADGWMPISSAPANVDVLLYCPELAESNPERIELGCASHGYSTDHISTMSYHSWATHWRPLPPPPTRAADQEG